MSATRVAGLLIGTDGRGVLRDPFLRFMLLLPLGVGLLVRWGLPFVFTFASRRWQVELQPLQPLMLSFLTILMPGTVGAIAGFLLLDQRDDGTLTALRVTPLRPAHYLAYRLTLPVLLSTAITVALLLLTGMSTLTLPQMVVAAFAAAPVAPVYALFLAAFARNKVEGFALMKAVGVVTIPPILAWWVAEPYQWLFGLVPYYWPAKLYWVFAAGEGGAVGYLAAGLASQLALGWLLLRRFERTLPR